LGDLEDDPVLGAAVDDVNVGSLRRDVPVRTDEDVDRAIAPPFAVIAPSPRWSRIAPTSGDTFIVGCEDLSASGERVASSAVTNGAPHSLEVVLEIRSSHVAVLLW
jgi:hypothetical protein